MGGLYVVGVTITDEHLTDYAIFEAGWGSVRVTDSYLRAAGCSRKSSWPG